MRNPIVPMLLVLASCSSPRNPQCPVCPPAPPPCNAAEVHVAHQTTFEDLPVPEAFARVEMEVTRRNGTRVDTVLFNHATAMMRVEMRAISGGNLHIEIPTSAVDSADRAFASEFGSQVLDAAHYPIMFLHSTEVALVPGGRSDAGDPNAQTTATATMEARFNLRTHEERVVFPVRYTINIDTVTLDGAFEGDFHTFGAMPATATPASLVRDHFRVVLHLVGRRQQNVPAGSAPLPMPTAAESSPPGLPSPVGPTPGTAVNPPPPDAHP